MSEMENAPEKYIMATDFRRYREAVVDRMANLDVKISETKLALEKESDELVRIDHENTIKYLEQEKRIQESEFMQTVGYDECVMHYWIEISDRGMRPKFRMVSRAEKMAFEREMSYLSEHTYA